MKRRTSGKWLIAAAVAALVGSAGLAQAAKGTKAASHAAKVAGTVSKLDTAAKTFVVTNKKKGETTVAYNEQTAFKQQTAAATAGTAGAAGTALADVTPDALKEGTRVMVQGKMENGKLQATQVNVGRARKKKNKAAGTT